ncbi:hypothetical protein J7E70_00770 [Variovorax paradoxus]|nr:hypothetical protein [Variovorax paradoxus]MBT2298984.1 hypothetical protein [Variovorax paradoxus]
MALDFDKVFQEALTAGINAAKPGGKMVEDWLRESALANESTLRGIADGVKDKQISRDTASMLLHENGRALESEAAALALVIRATAQAAVNAFLNSLGNALSSALKLAI